MTEGDAWRLPGPIEQFEWWLRTLGLALRTAVLASLRGSSAEELSQPTGERGGDTIFQLDLDAEEVLLELCARWACEVPFLLVAEGLEPGGMILPSGSPPGSAAFTLIVDPIDGTRGLMYSKRSAWALMGVAPPPRRGVPATLADVTLAMQVELPTARAALADLLWAQRGGAVHAETADLRTGTVVPFTPRPSGATSLLGGFATISKFFPGAKAETSALEETLFLELLGPPQGESPQVFDDEYISTGGQLYELMVGHDRFVADLRPLLHDPATARITCHPYDICTWPIAEAAGLVVTDGLGGRLRAPLDTESPVSWAGYANPVLHDAIQPVLTRLLNEQGATRG